MRYYVNMGEGDGAWRAVVRFEEGKDGLRAFLRREEEGGEEEIPIDACFLENGRSLHLLAAGASHDIMLDRRNGRTSVLINGDWLEIEVVDERELIARRVAGLGRSLGGEVRASMPGVVVRVEVEVGQEVDRGDTLCVVEAMKMQNPILAGSPGVVKRIHVAQGDAVAGGDVLVSLG